MADEKEILKRIEERLTQLEAVASSINLRPPGHVVDPSPFGGGFGGGYVPRWPNPVVDPAPWGGYGGYVPRIPIPTPVVDPAPWGGYGGYIPRIPIPTVVDPAPWGGIGGYVPRWPYPNPVVDPAPWGGGLIPRTPGGTPIIPDFGPIGDPAPFDLSRLNDAQLQSVLHSVNSERARLDSMEQLVNDQLANMKGKSGK